MWVWVCVGAGVVLRVGVREVRMVGGPTGRETPWLLPNAMMHG